MHVEERRKLLDTAIFPRRLFKLLKVLNYKFKFIQLHEAPEDKKNRFRNVFIRASVVFRIDSFSNYSQKTAVEKDVSIAKWWRPDDSQQEKWNNKMHELRLVTSPLGIVHKLLWWPKLYLIFQSSKKCWINVSLIRVQFFLMMFFLLFLNVFFLNFSLKKFDWRSSIFFYKNN